MSRDNLDQWVRRPKYTREASGGSWAWSHPPITEAPGDDEVRAQREQRSKFVAGEKKPAATVAAPGERARA